MKDSETFKLVSHSMGGAFSKGIENYIKERGDVVEYNVMINTYQVDKISNPNSAPTIYIDYQNTNDPVLFWFDSNIGMGKLENADVIIREKSNESLLNIHRSPISIPGFWNTIKGKLTNK